MENTNHIKKEKKLFNPLRLIVLLLIFLGLSFTSITLNLEAQLSGDGVTHDDKGRTIYPNWVMLIRGVSVTGEVCRFENTSNSLTYFIPTRFTNEWNAVKGAALTGTHDLRLKQYELFSACGFDCSLPWGGTILHGESVSAYNPSTVDCGSCPSVLRYCNNGTLSGSGSNVCNSASCRGEQYCYNNTCLDDTDPCIPFTCDQLDELAGVNDGLNCGSNLNNGCGGRGISCLDNCGAEQVCASCPPGSNHIDCYFGAEEGNTQGVCSNDTGCNAVVDVNNINERGRTFCILGYNHNDSPECPNITYAGWVHPEIPIYHHGDNCLINGVPCSSTNLTSDSPWYVTFDNIMTVQGFYASHIQAENNIVGNNCTPDTNGSGTGSPWDGGEEQVQ